MTRIMDNYRFDVTDRFDEVDKGERLRAWIEICSGSQFATGWAVLPGKDGRPSRLVFYWRESDDDVEVHPFPFQAAAGETMASFAFNWLAQVDYGPEPDHDGSNARGYRVFNEAWGRLGDDDAAFLAVEPAWALIGK